jgi:hypothetical protein
MGQKSSDHHLLCLIILLGNIHADDKMVEVVEATAAFEEDFFPMATQLGVGKKKRAKIPSCSI